MNTEEDLILNDRVSVKWYASPDNIEVVVRERTGIVSGCNPNMVAVTYYDYCGGIYFFSNVTLVSRRQRPKAY